MTQLFASSPVSEKRNFHGLSLSSKKHSNNNNGNNNTSSSNTNEHPTNHLPSKIKNFFRINSSSNAATNNNSSSNLNHDSSKISNNSSQNLQKTDARSNSKQSRFLPTIGRHRSTTVASDGNPLEDSLSPTAHANPYFAHQGHPALRHRNDGSLPSTPPDLPVPELQVQGITAVDQATTATKEELARKLRRVASAPNAQGLFADDKSGERPKTAELGKESLDTQGGIVNQSKIGLPDAVDETLAVPEIGPDGTVPLPGKIRATASGTFRRTYSSNSIKVRNVEVGPGSFDKIKLIGKGDVGKVYLVREKKSNRLYAMKGESSLLASVARMAKKS